MKDVYEVLRQKELEVSRLKTEVEALRIAVTLLLADGEAEITTTPHYCVWGMTLQERPAPQRGKRERKKADSRSEA
jgi:hypothetical protein